MWKPCCLLLFYRSYLFFLFPWPKIEWPLYLRNDVIVCTAYMTIQVPAPMPHVGASYSFSSSWCPFCLTHWVGGFIELWENFRDTLIGLLIPQFESSRTLTEPESFLQVSIINFLWTQHSALQSASVSLFVPTDHIRRLHQLGRCPTPSLDFLPSNTLLKAQGIGTTGQL